MTILACIMAVYVVGIAATWMRPFWMIGILSDRWSVVYGRLGWPNKFASWPDPQGAALIARLVCSAMWGVVAMRFVRNYWRREALVRWYRQERLAGRQVGDPFEEDRRPDDSV